MLIASESKVKISKIKRMFLAKFEMKDLDTTKKIFGMVITKADFLKKATYIQNFML